MVVEYWIVLSLDVIVVALDLYARLWTLTLPLLGDRPYLSQCFSSLSALLVVTARNFNNGRMKSMRHKKDNVKSMDALRNILHGANVGWHDCRSWE